MRNTNLAHRTYKQHWGPIPKDEEGRSFDIHHLDNNKSNNDYWNLIAVPIKVHYLIHESQGDWSACAYIASRMKISPQLISQLNKMAQDKLIMEGKHHFLVSKFQKEQSKKGRDKMRSLGIGFYNKEWQQNNPANKEFTCPNCGYIGKGLGNAKRWHFNNCRSK